MREILFRGKKKQNGEWIKGYMVTAGKNAMIYPDNDYGWQFVIPETVGQYTGLKDKNGKRIFEGDIVRYNDYYDRFTGEIVYEYGAFGFGSNNVLDCSKGSCDNFVDLWRLVWEQDCIDEPEIYYAEVIGNIHDNPELLEGKNEKI